MRIVVRMVLGIAILVGTLFGCAGRWDLPFAWAYVGIFVAVMIGTVFAFDKGLLQERLKPGPGGRDRHLRLLVIPFFLAHLAVAGLDIGRFHWSDSVPVWLQVFGLCGIVASFALSRWATKVNNFFSPVIRIQEERGHHLVTDGPYRWIRHPGYAATIVLCFCSGLMLGSWYSLIPVLGVVFLILRRTVLEDRFLREKLEGYQGYAERVCYRFIPGLW